MILIFNLHHLSLQILHLHPHPVSPTVPPPILVPISSQYTLDWANNGILKPKLGFQATIDYTVTKGVFGLLFFITQFLSLITHHLKYPTCLAPSLICHHSIFFTLFVGPIPVTRCSFFFFFFSITEPSWKKKKNQIKSPNLVKEEEEKKRKEKRNLDQKEEEEEAT